MYIAPGSRPFWPKCMHEPFIVGLILPYVSQPPWKLRRSPQILELEKNCQVCGKTTTGTNGLFCANFGSRTSSGRICDSAWYSPCYRVSDTDNFHINMPQDSSGCVQVKKGDEDRFKYARGGDHLITTFQCDTCLFFLLKRRIPINDNLKDNLFLRCMRRVSLDAMWSSAPVTVNSTRREVNKSIKL